MKATDIYDFVTQEEANYQLPISTNGWDWCMPEHIKTSFFYKFGRLTTGNQDDKPVKNIVRPILNLAYRAEDIDVKDIHIYVNNPDKYHLSFLVKKYHDDVFVRENDLDTFFDELKESKIDYGGGLCKFMNEARPDVVPLQSIAFCDQTDILSGPIAIKHYYSPDQLKEMGKYGWGEDSNGATASLDEVIMLCYDRKEQDKNERSSETPGKYIEVYEVHGTLPEEWLQDKVSEERNYVPQMHILCFYKDEKGEKQWITLFRGRESKSPFKFVNRDPVFGRALGFGGIEELFENQVWTNYSLIAKKDMLDAASKTILGAVGNSSAKIAARNNTKDLENLEILDLEDGDLKQIDTFPRNAKLFDEFSREFEEHAQTMGAAYDPVMGKQPTAGTPLGSVQIQVAQGLSLHEYRRGKFATFIEEIYKDWIIPFIAKQITKGTKFLTELSVDEMEYVGECLVRSELNNYITEKVLNGETFTDEEKQLKEQEIRDEFARAGNKRWLEILEGEFKGIELKVKVNVAGKQKNLAEMSDKLSKVFQLVISNPMVLDDPRAAKIFAKILEYSDIDPLDFAPQSYKKPQQMMQPGMEGQQPQQMQLNAPTVQGQA